MTPCPCGGASYEACCGPLHDGQRQAETAEALMRSRYSAFAKGLDDYLFRTWHPRTRPEDVSSADTTWTGLRILEVVDGGPNDQHGIVEFEARYSAAGRPGVMVERSTFERRAGRWFYLDAA